MEPSDKTKKKSLFTKGHTTNVGRVYSLERNSKISESKKGKSSRGSGWKLSEETKDRIRSSKIGSMNHQWKENNPSYSSVHKWLSRNFIKSTNCELCGSDKFIEWSLKTGYDHDHIRSNYLCLCSSCHKKYDYTDERKSRLSASLKGRKINWGRKISEANFGRKMSIESRKKMSVYRKANPGKRNPITGRYE